jgi:transposase-like protein
MPKDTRQRRHMEEQPNELTVAYANKLKPMVHQARKACGLRTQDTPNHDVSRQYTALLREYYENGGNLVALAKELGVAYSGIRRRVFLSHVVVSSSNGRKHSSATQEQTDEAIARVRRAKAVGTRQYHAQLATEYYVNGISLGKIAQGLGIKNASPLYYAVQRHQKREITGK